MQQYSQPNPNAAQEFVGALAGLRKIHFSYASYVRAFYPQIEQAIQDGIPLEHIRELLNQKFGLQGELGALKSALQRIRREKEAKRTLGIPEDQVTPAEQVYQGITGNPFQQSEAMKPNMQATAMPNRYPQQSPNGDWPQQNGWTQQQGSNYSNMGPNCGWPQWQF